MLICVVHARVVAQENALRYSQFARQPPLWAAVFGQSMTFLETKKKRRAWNAAASGRKPTPYCDACATIRATACKTTARCELLRGIGPVVSHSPTMAMRSYVRGTRRRRGSVWMTVANTTWWYPCLDFRNLTLPS